MVNLFGKKKAEPQEAPVITPVTGDGAPAGSQQEAGGKMIFPLDKGELPNLVQFLNMGRRTGVLDLDFYRLKHKGSLYFRDGEIYCARYEELRGLEALARMIQRSRAHSYFTNGVTVDEVNIEVAMSNLLVEAVVMADEQVDVEGAAAEESAAADEDSAAAAAYETVVRGGGRATPAPPRVGRAVKYGIAALVVVVLGLGGYVAYLKVSQAADSAASQSPAGQPVGGAPTPAPGQSPEATKGLITVAPVKWEAEKGFEQLKPLEPGPGIDDAKRDIEAQLKAAKDFFDKGDYDKALETYQATIKAIRVSLTLDQKRQSAKQERARATVLRQKCEAINAVSQAKELWEKALEATGAGETLFKAGSYEEALNQWKLGNDCFQKAEINSQKQQLFAAAKAAYEGAIQKVDAAMLDRFGGEGWNQVKALVAEAVALTSQEKLAEAADKYARAKAMLEPVVGNAGKARNLADFRDAMAKAAQAVDKAQWEEAEKNYAAALRIPGHAADATALRGLEDARLRGILVAAEGAKVKGQWSQVLTMAEAALKISPKCGQASQLAAEAKENLVPRLLLTAEADGKTMASARIFINKQPVVGRLPMTVRVETGKTYDIRIEVPADGNTYYRAFEAKHTVKTLGLQTIKADVETVKAPDLGKPWSVPELEMDFAPIKPGTFQMGAENARRDELPVRKVTISRYFWCGKYEITNGQYRKFVAQSGYQGATDVSNETLYLQHFSKGKSEMSDANDYPVCYVSWNNAQAFCRWLTEYERRGNRLPSGYVYRLPTEAEWEFCCRAGTPGDYAGNLDELGWYFKNSNHTQKVGSLVANAWGVFDMHGNVYEWCQDWMGPYNPDDTTDPKGPESGVFVVNRGGSWNSSAELCRSSWRGNAAKVDTRLNLGFRIVLGPKL